MDYKKVYEDWLSNPYFDEDTKAELKGIAGDEKEIEDRFYMELEFGTAGLRGVIGAGMNRMNIYTVRKATQGLANYIKKVGGQDRGVAIAYAVRKLNCIAGINVTASHNPAEYNGYKVYWEDGAQITPPHDTGIMDEVKAVTDFNTVLTMDKKEAMDKNLYTVIGEDIDRPYMEEIKKLVIHQDAIDKVKEDLKIVYTPLHGTGNIPVRTILKELGFQHVFVVKEQELPDGNFPTVDYPNPEAPAAYKLALELAEKENADFGY